MSNKKDYCSRWPDGEYGSCCKSHDECYSKGGDRHARTKCDKALRECVKKKSGKLMAWTMWLGVRLAGWSPWRFKRDLFMRKRK